MQAPKVKLEEIIKIGDKSAIVSNIYRDIPDKIEVIYLGDNNKALNEDVHWKNGRWAFNEGASAGYADNYERTKPFVEKLHNHIYLRSKGLID